MTDDPTPDQAGQASEGLQTSLDGYPDTRIAWVAPTPARAPYANTARFVAEPDDEPFAFAWELAILAVEDITSATVMIVARSDIGRNVAEVSLHATDERRLIPIGDADRLIERYRAFERGVAAGAAFRAVRRRGEWARAPDAIERAAAAYRALSDHYERVTDRDVIDYLHTSRATFYRVLGERGLQFADIQRMARDEGPE